MAKKSPRRFSVREAILFTVGLSGVIYEAAVHRGSPRSGLLFIYAAMMGLTAFIRKDGSL